MRESAYKYLYYITPAAVIVSTKLAPNSLSVWLQSLCLPLVSQIRALALVSSFSGDLSRQKGPDHTEKQDESVLEGR